MGPRTTTSFVDSPSTQTLVIPFPSSSRTTTTDVKIIFNPKPTSISDNKPVTSITSEINLPPTIVPQSTTAPIQTLENALISAGGISTIITATESIIIPNNGGSIPQPNPPKPTADPTSNISVIAGGVSGGIVALILVVVIGAYNVKQEPDVKLEPMDVKPEPWYSPNGLYRRWWS
ncbi:hypothetical protein BCR33DRAFT_305772 [Rhizoclosmatium globosum]|uniref:Uncharacterized protein n=1 Tax=Rhizoclosmatium globosum TaxID=329046 RepID=A0A1Y2C7C7_9FUNG|nr:hypothetical protein BCR33DRAFT_305772 [Rhizoclosmatium globosum]|eukprot:ORY42205.1 hypothetical protein BCR33DRAFT_305772 [Rhizoclosmatium globosum]